MKHETKAFKARITREELRTMREMFEASGFGTFREQADAVAPAFPQYTIATMRDMAAVCGGASAKTFTAYMDKGISFGVLTVLARGLDYKTQDFLLGEVIERKLQVSDVERVKSCLREGVSMAEAIGRATGEIKHDPFKRANGTPKTLDNILDEIARDAAKWRAKVAMALEAVGQAENAAGVHIDIFEKVYLLRHLIGEQYEFVDQKVKRYLTVMKKRVIGQQGPSAPPDDADNMKGEAHGDEAVDLREERDAVEAGPSVQDPPRQDESP